MIIVPNENIVSDQEDFVGDKIEQGIGNEEMHLQDEAVEEVALSDSNDEPVVPNSIASSRPRRTNVGAGVE